MRRERRTRNGWNGRLEERCPLVPPEDVSDDWIKHGRRRGLPRSVVLPSPSTPIQITSRAPSQTPIPTRARARHETRRCSSYELPGRSSGPANDDAALAFATSTHHTSSVVVTDDRDSRAGSERTKFAAVLRARNNKLSSASCVEWPLSTVHLCCGLN